MSGTSLGKVGQTVANVAAGAAAAAVSMIIWCGPEPNSWFAPA